MQKSINTHETLQYKQNKQTNRKETLPKYGHCRPVEDLLEQNYSRHKECCVFVIGNKIDLLSKNTSDKQEAVDMNDVEQFCQEFDEDTQFRVFNAGLISCKTDYNVTNTFNYCLSTFICHKYCKLAH